MPSRRGELSRVETGIEGVPSEIQRGWLSPSVAGSGRGWVLSQADPTKGARPH